MPAATHHLPDRLTSLYLATLEGLQRAAAVALDKGQHKEARLGLTSILKFLCSPPWSRPDPAFDHAPREPHPAPTPSPVQSPTAATPFVPASPPRAPTAPTPPPTLTTPPPPRVLTPPPAASTHSPSLSPILHRPAATPLAPQARARHPTPAATLMAAAGAT